ncbi:hypothetical protein PAAG_03257 [Paracoccidioides lutzii Pb01]|uniref:DUF3835 domain-containing protein n=1 Tax=Paracoccidioides lutzii (strain ATCC MYA-826 / Pb01) TaxID=502779 RepID=C1GXX4_PARBA|nr:hypothetical protein PAAG_03257 [Paracoccidioides lutzii Pb01]EEH41694.2 hypothetical protein PAAG_03257 [Paracoccidioides lutzii Pb01]
MTQPSDHLAGLERQRLQLEESVLELRECLYSWRLSYAEYDELKHDVAAMEENCANEDFIRIGREFGGSLVNENEIKILLGVKQGITRTKQQVVDAISRRMDYVQQNIKVLEKRILVSEKKFDAMLTVEHPGAINEEGLPITDIVEELDEDGNVVLSSTTTPDQAAPGILEVLKKAGMDDLAKDTIGDKQNTGLDNSERRQQILPQKADNSKNIDSSAPAQNTLSSEDTPIEKLETFASVAQATPTLSSATGTTAPSAYTRPTAQSEDNNDPSASGASSSDDASLTTDIDEPPEDAALRREMLKYSLEEVGAVVAELEMDESGSEFSVEDEYYMMSDNEDDEEEDEHGRSTRKMIDDDYRRQMMELEKKLNARSLENVGPNPDHLPPEIRNELDAPVSDKGTPYVAHKTYAKKEKKVTFADTLDIAPPAAPTSPTPVKERRVEPPSAPVVRDTVVERTQVKREETMKDATALKKNSRFKTARKAAEPTHFESPPAWPIPAACPSAPSTNQPLLPLFPAKPSRPNQDPSSKRSAPPSQSPKPLADKLVERTIARENAEPPDSYELNEKLHKQEIATEFYKIRNRKVHQEGGFLCEDEKNDGIIPLDDERQLPKKVSRFKAAHMK